MPRPATGPASRVKRLYGSLDRAKRDYAPGELLKQEPMRALLGVSRNTLRDWIEQIEGFEDSGAFVRGAQGQSYEYDPIATIWFLIRHFERERDGRVDAAMRNRELVGGDTLADLPEDFDLKQIREAIQVAALVREERVRTGELVDAQAISRLLAGLFSRLQDSMVTAASRADPTGQWPVHVREAFDDEISNVGIEMVRAGEALLGSLNGEPA